MRILSANLFYGRAEPQALVDLVERCDADVVACQEMWSAQAEALARVRPHGLLAPVDHDFRGMGIALRRPASMGRLPLHYRDARVALLDPADWPELSEPLEVLNVHVSSPTHPPVWTQPWRRRKQLEGLLLYLDGAPWRSRVWVGDFNSTPGWPVYHALRARLSDLAVEHARARGGRAQATWGLWPGSPRLLRLDHGFGEGVGVRSIEVQSLAGSDHSALLVDVEVPGFAAEVEAEV